MLFGNNGMFSNHRGHSVSKFSSDSDIGFSHRGYRSHLTRLSLVAFELIASAP